MVETLMAYIPVYLDLLVEMLKLYFSDPFCHKFKKDTLKFDLCSKSNGLHPCNLKEYNVMSVTD